MALLPKLIYRYNAISIRTRAEKKVPVHLFVEIDKLIQTLIRNWLWPLWLSGLSIIPQSEESLVQKCVMNIHSIIIHNSQNVETTDLSIKWWMDKQNVLYPYNGILLSHIKECTDTCYMDETWKHAKWKQVVT